MRCIAVSCALQAYDVHVHDASRHLVRVLLAVYACVPDRGTEPGFGWNWAHHLAAAGVQVTALTRMENRPEIWRHQSTNNWPTGLTFEFVDSGLKHLRPATMSHYAVWQYRAFLRARELDYANDYDLVHHATYGSLQSPSWLWRLEKPFILGPVGGGQVAHSAFRSQFRNAWRKERLREALVRMAVFSPLHRAIAKRTCLLLATNQETLWMARRMGFQNIEMFLDSGLPAEYYAKQVSRRTLSSHARLLWVGRLLPRKGVQLALDALAATSNPVELTILGDGPLGSEMQQWITERRLQNRVNWFGEVTWDKVRQAYQSHDGFLFTSLRDSFGSQLLEAMSQGLPVITLDHQGSRDFVPYNAGIKVPVADLEGTTNGLAGALDAFANLSTSNRAKMGHIGFSFAKQHSWQQKAATMISLYDRVLHK